MRDPRRLIVLALACLAVAACAPASAPAPAVPAPRRADSATVTLGYFGKLTGGIPPVAELRGGASPVIEIVHAELTVVDYDANVRPMLAERVPSLDDGSWVLNPDGTMSMTWHLRPNARWHDGAPFTSQDVKFSWEFANNNTLGIDRLPIHSAVTAIDTPDDHTAIFHWKTTSAFAASTSGTDFFLFPEHVVAPLVQSMGSERDKLLAQPFFHEGFVGLGAYRIESWTPDGTIVFKPFPDFFLGPPKIGTVVVRNAANGTGLLTLLLAGEVQITGRGALSFEQARVAEEQWAARGEGTVSYVPVGVERLILKPNNQLWVDPRVRQALLLAIDREQLIGTLFDGKVLLAHTLLHPKEFGYAAAEQAITKYPYDPQRALALLQQVGWRPGPEGVLVNAAGSPFELRYRVQIEDDSQVREQQVVEHDWKAIGVRSAEDNLTASANISRADVANYDGVTVTKSSTQLAGLFKRWHSQFVPRAENNYTGDNGAAWSNPAADRLLEQIETAVDPRAMQPLVTEIARLYSDDLPALPLYYSPEITTIARQVTNARPRPTSGATTMTWDIYEWDVE